MKPDLSPCTVNAQLNDEMHNTLHITRVMQEILNTVKYHFRFDYNEEALSYHRFVTHLKFFAQRLLGKNYVDSDDDSLYQVVKRNTVSHSPAPARSTATSKSTISISSPRKR